MVKKFREVQYEQVQFGGSVYCRSRSKKVFPVGMPTPMLAFSSTVEKGGRKMKNAQRLNDENRFVIERPLHAISFVLIAPWAVYSEGYPRNIKLSVLASPSPNVASFTELEIRGRIVGQTLTLTVGDGVSVTTPTITGTVKNGRITFPVCGLRYQKNGTDWFLKDEIMVFYYYEGVLHPDPTAAIMLKKEIFVILFTDDSTSPLYTPLIRLSHL
jgi:hypothetical protein